MLDVYLRSQVRAISVVIVICDLFGTNFYGIDEIYDLINTSDKKITRGFEINKDFLRDSLRNEEIKIVLREIFNGVIEYDTKWSGSKNSVTNPFLKHITIRYNMKHDMILDKIVDLYEIKEQEMSDYCSKEELIFFGRETVCLNFSTKELITILKTNLELRLDIYLKKTEARRLSAIIDAPRQIRELNAIDYNENSSNGRQRSTTPTISLNRSHSQDNSIDSKRSSNGRFGSSVTGSSLKTSSSSSLPPRPGSNKRTFAQYAKEFDNEEIDKFVKSHLKKIKGINDEDMLDRLLDDKVSKSTRTRSFLDPALESEIQSRVSITTQELEEQLLMKQLEIRRKLRATINRMDEKRAEEIANSIVDKTDIGTDPMPQEPEHEVEQQDPEDDDRSISSVLLQLVNRANVLHQPMVHSNGRQNNVKQVSVRTGLLCQDLHSNCGISFEKMQLAHFLFFTEFFGNVRPDVLDQFVKSFNTYTTAAEIASELQQLRNRDLYSSAEEPEGALSICIIIDASNKSGKELVAKPYLKRCNDGVIRQGFFRIDICFSKKSDVGSMNILDSLQIEMTDQAIWKVLSGCSDNWGLVELEKLLKEIDIIAMRLWNEEPLMRQAMTVTVHHEQDNFVYKYGGGWYRSLRCVTCRMHATERMLKPLLEALLGSSGIEYNAFNAANLYKLAYYHDKLKFMFDTLNVIANDGFDNFTTNLPPEVRKVFKKLNMSRWISPEATCALLIKLLDIEAYGLLETHVADFYGGVISAEWQHLRRKCCCFTDTTKVSHFMIALLYVVNHAPGKLKGDGYLKCRHLVGFLASPMQRISIKIVASLYTIHLRIAKFYNSQSEIILNSKTISNRFIEFIVFERDIVKFFYDFKSNWRSVIPDDTADYISRESIRAITLDIPEIISSQQVTTHFDNLISEATQKMWPFVQKYLINDNMKIGFNIGYATDPYLSVAWAQGVLIGLNRNANHPSVYNILPANLLFAFAPLDMPEQNEQLPPWTITSKYEAYPGVSFQHLKWSIANMFTIQNNLTPEKKEVKVKCITGIVEGYNMLHPKFILELHCLAQGDLKSILEDKTYWLPGWPVQSYWNTFKELFPCIAHSLIQNFGEVAVANTIVEQIFTVATTTVHPNQSKSSVQRDMYHNSGVRAYIRRELKPTLEELDEGILREDTIDDSGIPIRSFRSKDSSHLYIDSLNELADNLQPYHPFIRTRREMRGTGKRLGDIQQSINQTLTDMELNESGIRFRFGNSMLSDCIGDLHTATINNSGTIQKVEEDFYVEFMNRHKKFWTADNIRIYLYGLGEDIVPKDLVKRTPKHFNKNTPLEIQFTLVDLIIQYFRDVEATEQDLEAYVAMCLEAEPDIVSDVDSDIENNN